MGGITDLSTQNIITNARAIGSSLVKAYTGRKLTSGEIAMVRKVFGSSIDYSIVRVHGHGAYGDNYKDTAVTPDGQIYFNAENYKEDFSQESTWNQGWFMHEITHVWQHQKGFPVRKVGIKFHALSSDESPYNYAVGGFYTSFPEYNMEAQANLIEDYYAIFVVNKKDALSAHGTRYIYQDPHFQQQKMDAIKKIIEGFINSGRGADQLPANPYSLGRIQEHKYDKP
jgi:type VI secretion system secreted protein VgrG